jgi:anti-anti-sigma factor
MPQMTLEDRTDGRWIILVGEWDQQDVLQHKSEFDRAIQEAIGDVVVDMHETSFLGSLGIGLLVTSYEALAKRGHKLKLSRVPSSLEETFRILNLSELFERV